MADTRWVRNRAGAVVHRAECSRIKGKGIQWNWAEPHTTGAQLQAALVHAPWVKPCGACKPYEAGGEHQALAHTIEVFRKALMVEHSNDWDMDTISEAAHICAKALYQKQEG